MPKLAVFAHGSIDGGVRAEIHDGEAGQGCDLTEDDLRSRSKKLLSGAKGLLNFQKSLATEAPPDSKTTEYAVRSIEYWAEKQGIAPIGSIEVGHLLPDDPFIVVRFSPSKVMLLVRPKAEDVESADFCGQLFEPVRFSGRGAHPARLEYSSPRFADRTTRIALRR